MINQNGQATNKRNQESLSPSGILPTSVALVRVPGSILVLVPETQGYLSLLPKKDLCDL